MTDIELEQEIRKIFLEDKDVETVSFQQVSKDYAQKDLIKKVKKLIKDYLNGKVGKENYDLEEWCNPMKHNLELLEKLL